MKTLITLLVLAWLVSLSILATAQTAPMGETSFGVLAGINFQNINGKDSEGDKLDNDLIVGWHAGANVEIPVAPDFYVLPGLLYTQKGAKTEIEVGDETYSSTIRLSYLEVPVSLLYKPVLGSGYMLLGFGPYISYGIGGKAKYDSFGDEPAGEDDVEFMNEVGAGDEMDVRYFRPLDAGANIFFGYQWVNHFSAQLNAQLGLVDINPDYNGLEDDQTTLKHTGFGISLGYDF